MTICERCGAALQIGDYPLGCKGDPSRHVRGGSTVIGDEIDVVMRNGTREPIRFRSRGALKAWMQANGYVNNASHVPLPGTDKSPHTVNWTSRMDPYTAENVRILLERAFHAGTTFEDDDATVRVTPDIHEMTREEAARYVRR